MYKVFRSFGSFSLIMNYVPSILLDTVYTLVNQAKTLIKWEKTK